MAIKLDELYWDVTLRDKKLEAQASATRKKMKKLGDDIAKDLTKAFSDFDPVKNIFKGTKGAPGFRSPKVVGKQIGQDLLKGLEDQFKQRGSQARELLFRGVVNRKGFEREGREAARQFNSGLLKVISGLRKTGALTKPLERQLVASLKDTGEAAGRAFGKTFRSTILQTFFKTQRILRLAFAGGILSLITLVSRRVINLGRTAARAIDTILTKAGDLDRIRRAFAFLTTSGGLSTAGLLTKAREASAGLVDDLNLIKQLNFALQAGLPATEDQLARLVFVARRLGESVGRDATDAFTRLTNAIVKQERRVLDELGIVVRFQKAHKEWAARMGISNRRLTTQETILANLSIVSEKAEEAVRRLGAETDDVGKKYTRLKVNVENAKIALLDIVTASAPVIDILNRMNTVTKDFATNFEDNFVGLGVEIDILVLKLENLLERWRFVGDVLSGRIIVLPEIKEGEVRKLSDIRLNIDFPDEFDIVALRKQLREGREFEIEQRAIQDQLRAEEDINAIREERQRIDVELFQLLRVSTEELDKMGRIERAIFEERKNALRESFAAGGARLSVLRARAAAGEAGGGDPVDPAAAKKIAAAREELRKLNAEIAVLQSFGATTLAGIAAAPLREVAQGILAIDTRLAKLKQLQKDAKLTSDEVQARERELQAERAKLLERKQLLEDSPELLITESAKAAIAAIAALNRERSLLAAFKIDALSDIPPQAREVLSELDAVNQRITLFTKLLSDAALAGETEFNAALERGRDFLEAQRLELLANEEAIKAVGKVLTEFPDLGRQFFGGLDAQELDDIGIVLRTATAATKDLAEATKKLTLVEAQFGKKSQQATDARAAFVAAEAEHRRIIVGLINELPVLIKDEEKRAQVAAVLLELITEQDDKTKSLSKKLQELRAAVRGIIQLADAFGVLNESTRKTLQGVENLLGGIIELSKGNLVGGIIQAAGGFANILSGVFGESAEDKKRRISISENTQALNRLRSNILLLASAFRDLSSEAFANIKSLGSFIARPVDLKAGGAGPFDIFGGGRLNLANLGLTIEDLEAIADAAGISIDNLIKFLLGAGEGEFDPKLAADEFNKLGQVIRDDLDLDLFLKSLGEFANKIELLQAEFDIFDITEPEKQLRRYLEIADEFTDLPQNLQDQLDNILSFDDLTTPEAQKAIDQFLKDAFIAAPELFTTGALGRLRFDEWLDLLRSSDGFLDEIASNTEEGADAAGDTESAIIRKSITEVTGNRMVGVLTTIAIINQSILAIAKEILLEMGGTLPTDLQAITFRAPATQLDILEIEQQQLDALIAIRDLLAGGSFGGREFAAIDVKDIPFVPTTTTNLNPPNQLAPSVTIVNPTFNAEINTTGGVSVEDARLLVRQEAGLLVDEVDIAFAKRVGRQTTRVIR